MTQDSNRLKPRAPIDFVRQQEQEQREPQGQQPAPHYSSGQQQHYRATETSQEGQHLQAAPPTVEEEKPTEKMTIYITKTQARKIRQMIRAYEEQTDQRTDQNKLMRKFIDKLDLSMII